MPMSAGQKFCGCFNKSCQPKAAVPNSRKYFYCCTYFLVDNWEFFYFRSIIDQYFGGRFACELKCVESEEEPPTQSEENFLQLSCFISQDVKYMHSGLKSVTYFYEFHCRHFYSTFYFDIIETYGADNETVSHSRARRCLH